MYPEYYFHPEKQPVDYKEYLPSDLRLWHKSYVPKSTLMGDYEIEEFLLSTGNRDIHRIQLDLLTLSLSREDVQYIDLEQAPQYEPVIRLSELCEANRSLLCDTLESCLTFSSDRRCASAQVKRTVGFVPQDENFGENSHPSPYFYLEVRSTRPQSGKFLQPLFSKLIRSPWIVQYTTPKQMSNIWHSPEENEYEYGYITTVRGKSVIIDHVVRNIHTDTVQQTMTQHRKIREGTIEGARWEYGILFDWIDDIRGAIDLFFPQLAVSESEIVGPKVQAYAEDMIAKNI